MSAVHALCMCQQTLSCLRGPWLRTLALAAWQALRMVESRLQVDKDLRSFRRDALLQQKAETEAGECQDDNIIAK